jgi:DNA-binding MarR family transcriptional regulator
MNEAILAAEPDPFLLRTLADFRYELRRFLHFSERAALEAGLHPQQYQLLLQVAGAPDASGVTIAYAAERLALKHNSTVELVDRSEREGLLSRAEDAEDRRRTILRVTRKGKKLLDRLVGDHARELNERAPRLVTALEHIRLHAQAEESGATR